MADEVIADDVKLGQLAEDVTGISKDLRDALADTRETGQLKSTAFGNTTGAETVANSYDQVRENGGAAAEDLAEVLEGDIDRILRIAFAYQAQDEDNAGDVGGG